MTYKNKFKLYIAGQNPNGTSDLIITDNDYQVVGYVDQALFGNVPAKDFGWSGDSQGNISACFYGESIDGIMYDDEWLDDIAEGKLSDFCQVIEIDYADMLDHLAVSPVNTALEKLKAVHAEIRKVS